MFKVVLYNPEIPPNTGNIIRLCANTGASLHLIEPLGFKLEDKQARRAGLDYRDLAQLTVWRTWDEFCADHGGRILSFSTKNRLSYASFAFQPGDALLFGSETRGLPASVFEEIAQECRLHIPMRPDNRSLNLSNAVAIGLYEAWRQQGFEGSAGG